MSLNATLDRLKAEREARENEATRKAEEELQEAAKEYAETMNGAIKGYNNAMVGIFDDANKKTIINNYAESIFFQRMLKDINPGLSEPKIDAMIERSVMIATKLYNRLYR